MVISDEGLLQYEYSDNSNNPGFAVLDLNGVVIPEAFFPPNTTNIPADINSTASLTPYGNDETNEVYFFEVTYFNGSSVETAVLMSIFEPGTTPSEDIDHVFVLSSSDPNLTIPSTTQEFNDFFGSFVGVAPVTSGFFAPGAPIDFSQIYAPTLDSVSDNDTWTGTDDGEFFDGGDGADNLSGAGGDDVLVGGAGNDTLDGGTSTDDEGNPHTDAVVYALDGGTNGVNVNLGTGVAIDSYGDTDSLSGIEAVAGTEFADTLVGDANNNFFAGGDGADSIDGGDGIDEVDFEFLGQDGVGVTVDLAAGTAIDSWGNTDTLQNIENIFGSLFNDTISGDDGANVLVGGEGNDSLFGAGDDDVLESSFGTGESDTVDGGAGNDTLLFFADFASVTITADASGETTVTNGIDTVRITDVEVLEFNDATVELGTGSAGADTLTGVSDSALLLGFDGDDEITGTDNGDSLYGGGDNDTIFGLQGNDLIEGGDGDDELRGNLNGDTIYGGAGFDVIYGNFGFDSLYGGTFADTIFGGNQNDQIWGEGGQDFLVGQSGNDTIWGGDGFDTIRGGADDDLLNGGDRGDNLIGGIGNDTLNGEAGADRLDGNDGTDLMDGGDGNDNLFGGDGNDTILGGADDDRIFAGADDDRIDGGTGNDTMFGAAGVDTFVFGIAHGDDIIRDFDPNGEIIDLTALGTSFGGLTIANAATGTLVTTPEGSILLEGVALGDVTADDFLFD